MKFKFIEKFRDEKTRDLHYKKHVNDTGTSISHRGEKQYEFSTTEFEDSIEYEEEAEKLAYAPCEYSVNGKDRNKLGVHGFLGRGKKGNFVDTYYKYNSSNGGFTTYYLDENNEPINITFHFITPARWREKVDRYFVKDLLDI